MTMTTIPRTKATMTRVVSNIIVLFGQRQGVVHHQYQQQEQEQEQEQEE